MRAAIMILTCDVEGCAAEFRSVRHGRISWIAYEAEARAHGWVVSEAGYRTRNTRARALRKHWCPTHRRRVNRGPVGMCDE